MNSNNLTPEQSATIEYKGDLTLEALACLDTYTKQCCNVSATSRKLQKSYNRIRNYLKQPYVREIFKLKLLQKGVTPDRIAEVVAAGLNATNGVYYEGNEVNQEPNWAARQKFAQLAAEIFEVLKYQTKIEVNNSVNVENKDNQFSIERLTLIKQSVI